MAKADKKSSKPSRRAGDSVRRSSNKVKNLVVVESPAKAKTISRYLGPDFVVRASMGHVRDLPSRKLGVDVEHGFAPTYEPLPGRQKVLSELKKYAKSADCVFLATDLDREGEAIAWHLAQSLELSEEKTRRVIFNEITAPAIRQAFANPTRIDLNKVNAQQARRILDRIVGYKLSPLLWRKVATGLSAGRVQSVAVLLIVRREREIEAFQPQEYWRINAIFTPHLDRVGSLARLWNEFLATTDAQGQAPTQARQQEFLTQHQAMRAELINWQDKRFRADTVEHVLEIVRAMGLTVQEVQQTRDAQAKGAAQDRKTIIGRLDNTPAFSIQRIADRESRSRPPAPFTTATLQQSAAVNLRMSASRTMRIAQDLYEGVEVPGEGSVGLITYMRTDSTHLSTQAVSDVRGMINDTFGPQYIPDKPNVYAPANRAQQAHEAIRPTDPRRSPDSLAGCLSDYQLRLYRLIWQRFVACQMPPACWKITEADIAADTPAGQAVFRTIGRRLIFDGFYRVAGMPRSDEQILPQLTQHQPIAPVEISPTQHFTQPPPRYTEASLVKSMEAEGIGRPSTYATIIQTIQDRNYVRLEDRSFRPTDLGIVVTDKLGQFFPRLLDERFTAHMEDQLDKVEEDQLDWVHLLEEFYGPFKKELEHASQAMVHAKAESEPSEYTCEICSRPMVYRFSKNGRYLACTGYPECKTTYPVDENGKKIERIDVDIPCPLCGKSPMVQRRSRFGTFLGCTDYPNCKGTVACDKDGNPLKTVKPQDIHETCPDCGKPMSVRFKGRRAFLGCTGYPQCKGTTPIPQGLRIEPPAKAQPKDAGVKCPKCGKPMVIRQGSRGEFLACSGFPRCRNAMSLDRMEELKAQQANEPSEKPQEDPSKKPANKTRKKSSGK